MKINVERISGSLEGSAKQVRAAVQRAIIASTDLLASMLHAAYVADIQASGKFGARWINGLHVDVEHGNLRSVITTSHDIDYAGIFEEGGAIGGKPLLWIGLSGTDAEGVRPSEYSGKLFSGRGDQPLLFSLEDHKPKFFGIPAVNIPQKWHLREVQEKTMHGFEAVYASVFRL